MGGESPAKGDKHVTFSSEPEASPGPKIRRQPTGLPTEYQTFGATYAIGLTYRPPSF